MEGLPVVAVALAVVVDLEVVVLLLILFYNSLLKCIELDEILADVILQSGQRAFIGKVHHINSHTSTLKYSINDAKIVLYIGING